jgi:uncharacterized membrane protein YccC
MAALIAIGALLMILIGRRDETGLTAITIAVIMIIAASNPEDAWRQPLLRLVDTIVGIAVGVACKWIGSFVFFRIRGEEVRSRAQAECPTASHEVWRSLRHGFLRTRHPPECALFCPVTARHC